MRAGKGTPRSKISRWACALLAVALELSAAPAAADFEFNDREWEGTSELLEIARQELGKDRVQIVASLDYEKLTANDGVLILHPEVEINAEEIGAFLSAGGRLALIDDHGRGTSLLSRYQIARVPAPLRPAQSLRNNPELAIAIPAVVPVAGLEQNRHSVVANVERLVTNHPTALVRPNLTPVLEIPAVGEPNATLALTGVIGSKGRLFAMGDPSALINLMLRYPGNRAFASGLVKYMVEADTWGDRGGKLYLVSNDFRQKGQFGGESGIVRDAHELLTSASDLVAGVRKDGLPPSVAVVLAASGTLLLLAWALGASLKTYRAYLPRYAMGVPALEQGGLAGRAAVLAAPTTDHALMLAELYVTLLETLAARLGMDPKLPQDRLLEAAAEAGVLEPNSLGTARYLLRELARGPSALAASQRVNMPVSRLVDLGNRTMALVAEIEQRMPGSPSGPASA